MNTNIDEIDPEVVEQLKNSKKLRGPHDKVVLSADGKILVDGHQRKVADPDWPEEINPNLKTKKDCVLFSIDKNWYRTSKSENWKRSMIESLAQMGDTPKMVSEETGLPDYTVYRYYPNDLKDQVKAEAGKAGGEARASAYSLQAESEDLRKSEENAKALMGECANCHIGVRSELLKSVGDDKLYCPRCIGPAHVAFENAQKRLKQAEKAKKSVSPKELDSWEQRKANMTPHDSQFQQDVFVELAGEGYKFEQNQKVPVFTTEPDGLLRNADGNPWLLVYLDCTAVHQGKQLDRDDRLRDKYQKDHPESTVFGVPYTGNSEKEKARVKALIREKYDFVKSKKADDEEPLFADQIETVPEDSEEEKEAES